MAKEKYVIVYYAENALRHGDYVYSGTLQEFKSEKLNSDKNYSSDDYNITIGTVDDFKELINVYECNNNLTHYRMKTLKVFKDLVKTIGE